jgi:elongation factor G
MIESIADYDDTLMEKYLMEEDITVEEMENALRKATLDLSITPVLCGSAFKNKGVQTLLDSIVKYMPSPMDVDAIEGTSTSGNGEKMKRRTSVEEPFAALAFKIMTDPYVGETDLYQGIFRDT